MSILSNLPKTRFVAAAALAAAIFAPAGANARGNVVVSAPFEVGSSPEGNYLAATVAAAETDTLAASTFYRESLRYDARNRDLVERALVASLADGDMPEGFALAQRELKFDATQGLAHLALAARDMKARQWAAARQELGRKSGPVDLASVMMTAWAWVGQGDTKRALDTIDQIKDPRLIPFRDYHAGLIADLGGDATEAAKRFKSAYESQKSALRVVDAYGRFLSRHGDKGAARAVYEDFNKLLPRHPIVVAALKELADGRALDPVVGSAAAGGGEVLYWLGTSGTGDNDQLVRMIYLRLGLYLAPDNGLAIVSLADIYARLKQYERAVDLYNSTPERSPLRSSADIESALILDQMDRHDEALKQVRDIVSERPSDVEAVTALANLYRSRKQWPEAAAAYSKAIDLIGTPGPGDWSLVYSRGIARERAKQWPLAEADFRKALELKPDDPQVLNYLGYSWVDRGENLDEAFQMLRKAVDLSNSDGYIVDSLGWAFYKLGRYDEAQRELEKAIELKPGDPVINDHLGDIYWRVGRKLEAGFQWNHARDMKPDPEDLPKILDKIANGLGDDKANATSPATSPSEAAKGGG